MKRLILAIVVMVMVMGLASVAQAEWDVSRFVCRPKPGSRAYRHEHQNERRRKAAKAACSRASKRCKAYSRLAISLTSKRLARRASRLCRRSGRLCRGFVWASVFPRPCKARKNGKCGCACQRVSVGGYTFMKSGFCRPRKGVLHCERLTVSHPHLRSGFLREGAHRALCVILSQRARRLVLSSPNRLAALFAQRARVLHQALQNQYLIRDHLWKRIRRLEREAKASYADVRGQTRIILLLRKHLQNLERENGRQCLNLQAYMPGLRCRR